MNSLTLLIKLIVTLIDEVTIKATFKQDLIHDGFVTVCMT